MESPVATGSDQVWGMASVPAYAVQVCDATFAVVVRGKRGPHILLIQDNQMVEVLAELRTARVV
jgi:hypothetical protein